MPFVHLHNHSEYSLQDGASDLDSMLLRVKELGQTSLAITDHGNLFNYLNFLKKSKEVGIKPILGVEFYIAEDVRIKKDILGKREKLGHLTILVKNNVGYKNLLSLVTKSWKEFYYKPRLDLKMLKEHSEGLICLSGCMTGKVSQYILNDKLEEAEKEIEALIDIFGENFYIELQNHLMESDKKLLSILPKLANKYNLKCVATNDAHYATKIESRVQDALIAIRDNTTIDDPELKKYDNDEFYLKSEEEMLALFENPEWVFESARIAEQCNVEVKFEKSIFPKFNDSTQKEKEQKLLELCRKGFERVKGTIPKEKYKEYGDRVKYELDVINKNGFTDYFLIVEDLLKYADSKKILRGWGRGSAAGSMISYLLNITKQIDPIQYGLYFERFLNPSRVSPPDIDMDFSDSRRHEIVEYAKQKYAIDNCANILTFNCFGARGSLRDAFRVYGYSQAEISQITELVPKIIQGESEITLEKAYDIAPALVEMKNKYVKEFWLAEHLEGKPRNISTHASGFIVADKPVSEYLPMIIDTGSKSKSKGSLLTGVDMYSACDIAKLLKLDLLGLATLNVIDEAISNIKQNKNVDINIEFIDLSDEKTWKLFNEGKTIGIFQFESDGMRQLLKRAKPHSINELADCNGLYRPGAMAFIDQYCKVKNGIEEVQCFHPLMEPVLKETYGVLIFQESVMRMCQVLAGFNLSEADEMRKAIGKKKREEIDKLKPKFADGCAKNGIDKGLVDQILLWFTDMSRYNFNKSHAVSYSIGAFIPAFLKANYPIEFMAALLNKEAKEMSDYLIRVNDCKAQRIKVNGPNVNISKVNCSIVNNEIYFGLNLIKGVDEKSIYGIIKERESGAFTNYLDFITRCNLFIDKSTLNGLVHSGAMQGIVTNRKWAINTFEELKNKFSKRKKVDPSQIDMFSLESTLDKSLFVESEDNFTKNELLSNEKEHIGFYSSGSPLDEFRAILDKDDFINSRELKEKLTGDKVKIGGIIKNVKIHIDKNKNEMAFIEIEDDFDIIKGIVFSNQYEKFKSKLKIGNPVSISGEFNKGSVLINKIDKLKMEA